MRATWKRVELDATRLGGVGTAPSLGEGCQRVARVCASTEGEASCLLLQPKPFTPLLGTSTKKELAVPAPLKFFEGSKVCSDAFFLEAGCLRPPVRIWFPDLPDPDVASLEHLACCTPPKSCPNASQLCRSKCSEDSLCAWLEVSDDTP